MKLITRLFNSKREGREGEGGRRSLSNIKIPCIPRHFLSLSLSPFSFFASFLFLSLTYSSPLIPLPVSLHIPIYFFFILFFIHSRFRARSPSNLLNYLYIQLFPYKTLRNSSYKIYCFFVHLIRY